MRFSGIVLATLFIFGVLSLFKAPNDPDFGWHYKYGEYIVQHKQILRENIYSYTFLNYQWANSYWFAQVVLYLAHQYLGHLLAGLIFASTLSLATIFYVKDLTRFAPLPTLLATLSALLLFVEFSGSGVTGRPMYFSTLFLMLLLSLLLRSSGGKRLWLLPPLFLLWANAHADFVLGLFILGLYVINRFISVLGETRKAILLVGTGLLSVVITLLNPYGIGLWQTLVKESHPYQFSYISEWVPASTDNLYYFGVYCATLGLIVSALIGARHKFPVWYLLAVGFFCIASVRSQYFFRIAVIVGIPAFIVFWRDPLIKLENALSRGLVKKAKAGLLALLALSVLVITTVFVAEVSQSTNQTYWLAKQAYPKEALDFALANNIQGNVFNYYGWGGYMIWYYPQVKTFIDGRMPSWRQGNASVFEDYVKIVHTPKTNSAILDDYKVNWILYPTESQLVTFLQTPASGWTQVYSSDTAALFVRETHQDSSIITP